MLPLDQILGAIQYIPLNVGEAWGHLRIFPPDNDELTPTDIPVFDELPLDLSVVAGVLTRAVQDTNSHVNLKSKERNTPNAVLRDAGPDHPRLAPFADQPVHLVVGRDDFLLEPTTDEIVAQKLAERIDRPLVELGWEPETELRSYDEIAAGSPAEARAYAPRYGSKAANIGFLAHRDVLGRVGDPGSPSAERGYDLVPQGFAIPLQAYRDFLEHPPNADIRQLVDALVADEQAGTLSPKQRAERVEEVQLAFLAGSFPPGALERVRAKITEIIPGVEKIKVRSSANAEDVPNFDGAGLHDSYAADTDKRDRPIGPCLVEEEDEAEGGEVKRKVKPKSVGCAIKGVYASLWNKRAVEERSFARIDQSTHRHGAGHRPGVRHRVRGRRQRGGGHPGAQHRRRLRLFAVGAGGQQPGHQPGPGHVLRGHHRRLHLRRRADQLHGDPVREAGPGRAGADRAGARPRTDAGAGGVWPSRWSGPIAGPNPTTTRTAGSSPPPTTRPPRSTWSSRSWRTGSWSTSRSASSAVADSREESFGRRRESSARRVSPRRSLPGSCRVSSFVQGAHPLQEAAAHPAERKLHRKALTHDVTQRDTKRRHRNALGWASCTRRACAAAVADHGRRGCPHRE